VMSTASNSSLKQSCSAFTGVTSALEVNFNVMRYINSRFADANKPTKSYNPKNQLKSANQVS